MKSLFLQSLERGEDKLEDELEDCNARRIRFEVGVPYSTCQLPGDVVYGGAPFTASFKAHEKSPQVDSGTRERLVGVGESYCRSKGGGAAPAEPGGAGAGFQ